MRPSLRFLGLVVIGWAGVRAYTLGAVPGGSLSLVGPSEAKPAPPIVPTEFPPIAPVDDGGMPTPTPAAYPEPNAPQLVQTPPAQARPVAVPVY